MLYSISMKRLITPVFICLFTAGIFAQSINTPDDYALTVFKKLNDTQTKLTYMNKNGALEKVGTETVNGKISGTLFYDVKIKGFGAEVTLLYTNYSDEEGWVYDGKIITHSTITQNGNFEGTLTINCDNPGQIIYDQVIMKKGMPASGNYIVSTGTYKNSPVEYKVYLKSKE